MENKKFRSNKIVLLGDTHSTNITFDIIGTRVEKGADLIHLGDGGFGFGPAAFGVANALSWMDKINKLCKSLDINLYHIRGNHDNTSKKIWESEWSNVFLINTESYATFPNGKKALLLSGGVSIDRCLRTPNHDYWFDEGTHPIENVEKCDIMFSHDTPEQFNHSSHTIPTYWKNFNDKDASLYSDCLKQRVLVGDIVKNSECKTIFYGHFHNEMAQDIDGVYARCININDLFFFDAENNYKL